MLVWVQVGSGSFGVVYKGVWQGAVVAIKYMVSSSAQQLQLSTTEAVLSKLLAHPNVRQHACMHAMHQQRGYNATSALCTA